LPLPPPPGPSSNRSSVNLASSTSSLNSVGTPTTTRNKNLSKSNSSNSLNIMGATTTVNLSKFNNVIATGDRSTVNLSKSNSSNSLNAMGATSNRSTVNLSKSNSSNSLNAMGTPTITRNKELSNSSNSLNSMGRLSNNNFNEADARKSYYASQTTSNYVPSGRTFHVPLEEVKLQHNVPIVVEQAIQYLEQKGVQSEGILRLSGNSTETKKFRDQYDAGQPVDLSSCSDMNSIGGLLKLFFRELPRAILANTDAIKRSNEMDEEAAIEVLKEELTNIPELNYFTMKRLFGFLYLIAYNADHNKMSSTNLAIVFQPTLHISQQLIMTLIDRYNEIFVK